VAGRKSALNDKAKQLLSKLKLLGYKKGGGELPLSQYGRGKEKILPIEVKQRREERLQKGGKSGGPLLGQRKKEGRDRSFQPTFIMCLVSRKGATEAYSQRRK